MSALGQKRKGSEREQMLSALLPKADVRLARSNEYTPLATRKTYMHAARLLRPLDDIRQESPRPCHVFAIEITDKRAMRRTTDA